MRKGAWPVRYPDLSPGGSETAASIDSLSPQYSPFSSLGEEDPDTCWHTDFLDATSPKLLIMTSPADWEHLHRTGEVKSIKDILVEERKKRGLEKMKDNNEAQKAKAKFEKERKSRKQREETKILDAAIKIAQLERSQLRTEEERKKQKQKKEKQREKDQEEDQSLIDEVSQNVHATKCTRRTMSRSTSPSEPPLSPPPFITPQPSRPMTRACRARQNQLLWRKQSATEKAPQPATPKASRSTSSTPRKASKKEGETSLDCFFSSDPNSELSQIESFMEQSGRHTPISSSKRLFNLSDHAIGSKKIKMGASDDSYEWSDMFFTQGDFQASAPSHEPAHAHAKDPAPVHAPDPAPVHDSAHDPAHDPVHDPAHDSAHDPADEPAPAHDPAPAIIDNISPNNSAQEVIQTDKQRP